MMNRPSAIFFDLDGTLLDGRTSAAAFASTFREIALHRPGLTIDVIREANQQVWAAYWPQVEDDWTLGVLDGAAVSLEAWRRTLEVCGVVDDALAQLALESLTRHSNAERRLYEDAAEALGHLVGRVPLALITNGAADTQRDKLRTTGIEASFDAILVSGEHGIAKPDSAIFKLALDQLQVAPEQVWHIGDSLVTDVAGAVGASIKSVWLNRDGLKRDSASATPDYEIASLAELTGLLGLG
jgi:putative hydrolase of the HAD superfamily